MKMPRDLFHAGRPTYFLVRRLGESWLAGGWGIGLGRWSNDAGLHVPQLYTDTPYSTAREACYASDTPYSKCMDAPSTPWQHTVTNHLTPHPPYTWSPYLIGPSPHQDLNFFKYTKYFSTWSDTGTLESAFKDPTSYLSQVSWYHHIYVQLCYSQI